MFGIRLKLHKTGCVVLQFNHISQMHNFVHYWEHIMHWTFVGIHLSHDNCPESTDNIQTLTNKQKNANNPLGLHVRYSCILL